MTTEPQIVQPDADNPTGWVLISTPAGDVAQFFDAPKSAEELAKVVETLTKG